MLTLTWRLFCGHHVLTQCVWFQKVYPHARQWAMLTFRSPKTGRIRAQVVQRLHYLAVHVQELAKSWNVRGRRPLHVHVPSYVRMLTVLYLHICASYFVEPGPF